MPTPTTGMTALYTVRTASEYLKQAHNLPVSVAMLTNYRTRGQFMPAFFVEQERKTYFYYTRQQLDEVAARWSGAPAPKPLPVPHLVRHRKEVE